MSNLLGTTPGASRLTRAAVPSGVGFGPGFVALPIPQDPDAFWLLGNFVLFRSSLVDPQPNWAFAVSFLDRDVYAHPLRRHDGFGLERWLRFR